MTTNEAVAFLEEIVRLNNEPLKLLPSSADKIVQEHLDKCREALIIIKQDLRNGYRHYTGDCENEH